MDNKFAILIGGIVFSLLICYYLQREIKSTRARVSDVERAVTLHHKAFESLGGPDDSEEKGEGAPVEEESE